MASVVEAKVTRWWIMVRLMLWQLWCRQVKQVMTLKAKKPKTESWDEIASVAKQRLMTRWWIMEINVMYDASKKSWPWNQRQNPEMKLNGKCGKITYWCQQKSETSDDPDSGETKSWDEIATVDFWLLELQRLQSKGKGRQMTDNHRTKCNHCSFQWS